MSTSTKREKLFKSGAAPREPLQILTVDGDVVDLEIRGLSSGARGRLMNTCMLDSEDEDGDQTVDLEKMTPALVTACTYDPDTGERVFGDEDRDALNELAATFIDLMFKTASRLSGLGKDANKSAEKNSDVTTGSASVSLSLAN